MIQQQFFAPIYLVNIMNIFNSLVSRLLLFIKIGLFWLIFFISMRLLFMLYQMEQSSLLSFNDWIKIFSLGLWMDTSMTGYILIITGILISALFFSEKFTKLILRAFNIFLLVVFVVTFIADMELYYQWGYRIDATPLFYLKNPDEAFASVEFWKIAILLVFSGVVFYFFFRFYKFFAEVKRLGKGKWWIAPIFIFLSTVMIIPVRGGFGVAPMNPGKVFFSQNVFSNHAALNGIWNLGYGLTLLKSMGKQYPEYITADEAEPFIESLNKQDDKAPRVLSTIRPNIVVILMESFTSKFIEPLNGKEGVTPNLNNLSRQGLLFSNIYASGDRSDKGLVSILGGFPAQSTQSVILFPPKASKLPTLSRCLDSIGYQTSFYYGGDPDFANIRSFLYSARFQRIISLSDFSRSLNYGKWGVPDEYVFKRLLADLDEAKPPFFKFFFTLSSHEPFEFPSEPAFPGNNDEDRFASSVFYTDQWLGWFFKEAMSKPYYDSTIFIVLADHGHRLPGNNRNHEPEKFAIPMLWLGGVLDSIGTVPNIGSQIDLVRTLLYQLDVNAYDFPFSRNLLSSSNSHFAYYAFNDGFGFITDSCRFIWDHKGQMPIYDDCSEEKRKEAFSFFKFYIDYFIGL